MLREEKGEWAWGRKLELPIYNGVDLDDCSKRKSPLDLLIAEGVLDRGSF